MSHCQKIARDNPMECCPYDELFIYYCRGSLPAEISFPRSGFLGAWEEEGDCFLFFGQAADHVVNRFLKTLPAVELIDTYHMTYEQWQGRRLEVVDAGNFLIAPAWYRFEPAVTKPCLWLDPGVVFGNCQHPTTLQCLEAIKRAFARRAPRTVADLGTGTGVLALVCALLGAEKVLAVDLNALAVTTAMKNVRLNDLEQKVLVVRGRADNFMDLPFDLVVSNIHYDVMRQMLAVENCRLPKQYVLSGLFRSQARLIEEQLRRQGVRIVDTWHQDGIWHTFLASNF